MTEELSGKTVVLFIACGVLTFLLVFVFAKRQITRFTLRSLRGPHEPLGHDAPKTLRREMERFVSKVENVKYEPQLLSVQEELKHASQASNDTLPSYVYRMKALDALTLLYTELNDIDPSIRRSSKESLRMFLLGLLSHSHLKNMSVQLIQHFADTYEVVRHESDEFGPEDYMHYMDILTQLVQCSRCPEDFQSSRVVTCYASASKLSDKNLITNGRPATLIQRPSSLILRTESLDNELTLETSL